MDLNLAPVQDIFLAHQDGKVGKGIVQLAPFYHAIELSQGHREHFDFFGRVRKVLSRRGENTVFSQKHGKHIGHKSWIRADFPDIAHPSGDVARLLFEFPVGRSFRLFAGINAATRDLQGICHRSGTRLTNQKRLTRFGDGKDIDPRHASKAVVGMRQGFAATRSNDMQLFDGKGFAFEEGLMICEAPIHC